MKKLVFLFLSFVCLFSLSSCKQTKFDPEKGVLRVGLECAYAPFNWTEVTQTDTNVPIKGKVSSYAEGYDIMVARRIADELGYELEIYKYEFDGLIMALNNGSIDLIIAGMSPTEERKQSINFSDAYYRSEHVLLLQKTSEYVNAKTFEDLAGAKVIGQKGTLYDDLAKQISQKNSSVKYQAPLDTVNAILVPLRAGALDLTVLEEPVAIGICEADSSFTYIKLDSKFDVADEDLDVAIGVRKVDTDLLSQVNAALAKITQEERISMMERAIALQSE